MNNVKQEHVKVSSKYQVVIPKRARKTLGMNKPSGYIMRVKKVTDNEITLEKVPDWHQFAGSMPGAWGPDPTAYIRKMRDTEWE